MLIKDVTPEHESSFVHCLEEWSEEIKEGGELRQRWIAALRLRGLRAKLAIDEDGVAAGMIQYGPCEDTDVDGPGLYFIYCIWVHGHDAGPGNRQNRGAGTALLAAAEEDVRALGARGLAAWGLRLPIWMRASWFKKHGYRSAHRRGMAELVWKPFGADERPPRWREQRVQPQRVPGKVTVTACNSGWCAGRNVAHERARRAAEALGDDVAYRLIDTTPRETVQRLGCMDALFLDDRELKFGAPPRYEKLERKIARRVEKTRKQRKRAAE